MNNANLFLVSMKIKSFTIPSIPPSSNTRLIRSRTTKQLISSSDYRDWKEAATLIVAGERFVVDKKHYPIKVSINVYGGKDFDKRRDLANVEKPICDAMKSAGMIVDDNVKFVNEISMSFKAITGQSYIFVEIEKDEDYKN